MAVPKDRRPLRQVPGGKGFLFSWTEREDQGFGPLSEGHWGKINKQIKVHTKGKGKPIPKPPWPPFSDGAYVLSEWGASKLGCRGSGKRSHLAMSGCLAEYEWWEDQLKTTEFYKAAVRNGDPNPLSQAQWQTWEDVMRTHPRPNLKIRFATHSPLWAATHGSEALQEAKARWVDRILTRPGAPRAPATGEMDSPLRRAFAEALALVRKEIKAKDASPRAQELADRYPEDALARLAGA